jgi:hypothetical protein
MTVSQTIVCIELDRAKLLAAFFNDMKTNLRMGCRFEMFSPGREWVGGEDFAPECKTCTVPSKTI